MTTSPLAAEKIPTELARLRALRMLAHVPLLALFFVAIAQGLIRSALPDTGEAIWESAVFQVLWYTLWAAGIIAFFLGFVVRGLKCPRCGQSFHMNNYLRRKTPWWINEFTRSCLHCGLRLNGTNAHDAP